MAINKITIDKIASQALEEISYARTYKQGKVTNWQKNEEMYYGRKRKNTEARANVALGRMQEFVHVLLSKIDNPLVFKFTKRKNSQLKRVDFLNSLRQRDQDEDNWDMKDIVGKKQAIIYGRAIYSYFADSVNGKYKPHLEPIDVYDFLIDPSCGGINVEEARFMGSYSVMLDSRELREGVRNKIYNAKAVQELLDGSGNANASTQEETNKLQRTYDQTTIGNKEIGDRTKYKFWRWFTTYQGDGKRYYLLMDNNGRCIRCEELADIFDPTDDFPLGAFPIWTWAAFPDLTEFWTPSYCDYAREIFMAQEVSINQMLDNAEAINKPQKVVNTSAIENLASLKYRRDGIIKTKGDYDANRAVQVIQTPSIRTPIEVFNLLEEIQGKSSGVNDGTAGVADERGKVGIYEGNQQATADRFGLLNKSYSHGYRRFAKLWKMGVQMHLTKKVAVDIMGVNGVEVKEVTRRDIFRKGDDYGLSVEASNAQTIASIQDQTAKINFLSAQANNESINKKKAFEMMANIAGFTEDQIEELLDTTFYGNAELMSEADRDIENLLDGEDIKPNTSANNAYKQRFVNYLKDHEEDINFKQFERISAYVMSLDEIIMKNEVRAYQQEKVNQLDKLSGLAQNPKGEQQVGAVEPELPPEPALTESAV